MPEKLKEKVTAISVIVICFGVILYQFEIGFVKVALFQTLMFVLFVLLVKLFKKCGEIKKQEI